MKPIILDTKFYDTGVTATYLFESNDGLILIETGADSSFSNILNALTEHGYTLKDVRHVFVTHIHLDHSGAAWHFAKEGSNIYVHPRGAPHLINPERLLASAKMIYKDKLEELTGRVEGIAEDKVISISDGEETKIGGVTVTAFETLGHASHHHSYLVEDSLYTGDIGGIRAKKGPVIPPTPPPDIHLDQWHESIEKMSKINPKMIYPTHFGGYEDVGSHLNYLAEYLDKLSDCVGQLLKEGKNEEEVSAGYKEYYRSLFGSSESDNIAFECYEAADPYWMNLLGLVRYWNKYRLAE